MSSLTTVALADRFEIIREGICARISATEDLRVIGEADDGFKTLKICRSLKPDILLLDWDITRPSGSETLRKVAESCPETKVIILSSEPSFEAAVTALGSGASGFLPKQSKGRIITEAVRALAAGYVYLPINYISDFVRSRQNVTRTGNAYGLSRRELEVLDASLSGKSNKEIAAALDISTRTVETHRNNIYRKTNCRNLEDLTQVIGGDLQANSG